MLAGCRTVGPAEIYVLGQVTIGGEEQGVVVPAGVRVLGISIITDQCLPDALEPASLAAILATAGRAERPEPPDETRPIFQHDRDRISATGWTGFTPCTKPALTAYRTGTAYGERWSYRSSR